MTKRNTRANCSSRDSRSIGARWPGHFGIDLPMDALFCPTPTALRNGSREALVSLKSFVCAYTKDALEITPGEGQASHRKLPV